MASDCEPRLPHESDDVLGLAMTGDAAALDRLFAPCMPRLQKTAAKLLRNAEDAEDALQDGLLAAFRHLDQFEGRSRFTTWMHTIVVNAARSKLRQQRSRPLFFSLDQSSSDQDCVPLAETLADPQASLDDRYAEIERSRILIAILDELPTKLRPIVLLCDIEGLRLKEAAARLGLTVSAVKTRHFRASRLLLHMAKGTGAHRQENNDIGKTVRPSRRTRRDVGSCEPYESSESRQGRSKTKIL